MLVPPLTVSYPRIQPAIGNIHYKINHYYDEREHQTTTLNHREIMGKNGTHYQSAHTRYVKNSLDEYGTPENKTDIYAYVGNNRDETIFENMSNNDSALT